MASDAELTTENDFASIQSQENVLFQPDQAYEMLREGVGTNHLKVGVNKMSSKYNAAALTTAQTAQKSPFIVPVTEVNSSTKILTSQPASAQSPHDTRLFTLSDSPPLVHSKPQTTQHSSHKQHFTSSSREKQAHALPTIDSQSQFSSSAKITTRVIESVPNSMTALNSNVASGQQSPWVFVPKPSSGSDTSRVLKVKHHDELLAHVKVLEAKLKEQKRINEKKQQEVMQAKNYLEKQKVLTEQIKSYETKQSEAAMTLHMSLDQTSSFNPEISITQYTDKSYAVH